VILGDNCGCIGLAVAIGPVDDLSSGIDEGCSVSVGVDRGVGLFVLPSGAIVERGGADGCAENDGAFDDIVSVGGNDLPGIEGSAVSIPGTFIVGIPELFSGDMVMNCDGPGWIVGIKLDFTLSVGNEVKDEGLIVCVGFLEMTSGDAVMGCVGPESAVGAGLNEVLAAGDDENDDSVGWDVVNDDSVGKLESIRLVVGFGLLELFSGVAVALVCDGPGKVDGTRLADGLLVG
jgi:hypothetical protein